MISRISLSRFYHVHNLNMYVCERSPKQRTRVGARSMEPVRGFERSQTELQEAIFSRYIDNRNRQHKASLSRKKLERYAAELRDPFSSRFPVTFHRCNREWTLFFLFFFPLNKLSIEHVSASAQIFPFRWISRLVHYGGMEIAWNCRLRMQIGYTSVWNEPLSWWNHGELIRGQYCVKGFFHCLFFDNRIERNEWRKETSCNWISRNFCYNLWDLNVMRRRKKVMVNISFSNFGMVWRKLSSKITGQDL